MKKWKKLLAVLLILLFVLPQTVGSVHAASGKWVKGADGYKYLYSTGKYAKSEWVTVNGRKYYCKSTGYRAVGWQKIGGKKYYFTEKGIMKTGWLKLDGKKYYLKSDGVMATGKVKISGKTYSFGKNGALKTGKYDVGDTIRFGSYEQDNISSNGKEAIEWIVLDVKSDGSLFVISKYALDKQSYNATYTNMTWEKSAIRSWLNGSFYSTAFSAAEKAKIKTTTLENAKNPYTGTSGGNSTKDKVFLLSLSEAKKYFSKDKVSKDGYTINPSLGCKPTKYTKARGAMTYDFSSSDYYAKDLKQFTGNCWWWLRSPGPTALRAAYVNNLGDCNYVSFYIYNTDCAVRPAMVVKP